MIIKTDETEIAGYLTDASNISGGRADALYFPANTEEVSEAVRDAREKGLKITVSGARTGTVGGAVPFGGAVISLERLDSLEIDRQRKTAVAGAGALLTDLQKASDAAGLYYPPDPTEWSCQLGGTVATNASGARSFRYGSTRNFVNALTIVLASGEILKIARGSVISRDGTISVPLGDGSVIDAKLPGYPAPDVRKNTCGYFSGERVDAVDLFIGSEGTLGIITEIEFRLVDKPAGSLSGIVFFSDESDLLGLVDEVRNRSFATRASESGGGLNASLVEYFDRRSLDLIAEKFPDVPPAAAGAVFFEQETGTEDEDALFEEWNSVFERHRADLDSSWFAVSEQDIERMRAFRHALPVTVNERVVRNKQRKIGTDMAVPDPKFRSFLDYCRGKLDDSGIEYVIFGHIGDGHLHINLLPKDDGEAARARHLYGRFVAHSIMLGGTVSAEHGIGKLKSKYLYVMYGERYLNEMAELKKAFDPDLVLSLGNMIDPKFLG